MRIPFLIMPLLLIACATKPDGGGGGDDDDVDPTGDGGPNGGSDGGTPQNCETGFGAWTGTDNVPPSQQPPCGLSPDQVPMFVGIGWDDNGDAAGMSWAIGAHKAVDSHATFFVNSVYGANGAVKQTWITAAADGHEIGNHTVSHLPNHGGRTLTVDQWLPEISGCSDFVTSGVIPASELFGFRTPYLEYSDFTLEAVKQLGFYYDCSIEEGYEDDHDGTNYFWPYTLDNLSPGHTTQVEWMDPENPLMELSPHPGLWELPVYAVIAPPDDKCAEYGLPTGFRARLQERQSWFDPVGGKITGFDYNLWASRGVGGFEMTKAEFLATLKYTFDLRYTGNRAPFLFGTHSAYYVDSWSPNAAGTPSATDRQAAIEEFLAYVKAKNGVQIASHREILEWLRNPE